jgi:hypothetical protein
MLRFSVHPSRRAIGLATAGLVLSSTAVLTAAHVGAAGAATLTPSPTLTPTSGTDSTLFNGSLTAACPVGTTDSYWTVDGPDLPADQANIGPGNTTGTGAQSFNGASIANLKSANAGSFAASGVYNVRFSCFGTSSVTDSYVRKIQYTAGGSGAWAYLVAAASTTTLAVSPTTAYTGDTVTLTATVAPSAAAGTVQFKDGGSDLGSPVTVTAGSAQLPTSALTTGAHTLTAVFTSADTDAYASSTSAAKSYTINGAPTWRPALYPAPHVGAVSLCLASFGNVPTNYAYAWYLNGVAIGGATGSSYTVPETAYTKKLSCKVTATNPVGSVNGTSAEAVVAVGRALIATVKPYIYGTVKVGYTDVAKVGTWSPAATSYTYAWYVNSTKVSSSYAYKIPAANKGKYLSLIVTAKRTAWTPGSYHTAKKLIG